MYSQFYDNALFEDIYNLNKKNPELASKMVGYDISKNKSVNEDTISYSQFFVLFLSGSWEGLLQLSEKNYLQNKDIKISAKKQKMFTDFIEQMNSLNNATNEYDMVVKKYVDKYKIKTKSIHNQILKYLNACNDSRVSYALNYFKNNPKSKVANQSSISSTYDEKSIQNSVDLSKIVELPQYVIGQNEAVTRVIDKILGSMVGFKTDKEPIATFLMTGPTGVGKTETAKAVANICFGGKIFTVDMTSFKTKGDISRLLGASPNYVGYGDRIAFCDFVEENPQCVILFDEIEKADRECLDILMRMLDEGEFITARGKIISLKDAVIFCTTNLTEYAENQNDDYLKKLTSNNQGLRKEIVGRFQEVLEYNHLSKDACKKIAQKFFLQKQIDSFNKNNANNGLKLCYNESLLDKIIDDANTDLFGARDIKKSIQKNLIAPVAQFVVKNRPKNATIYISANDIKLSDNSNENYVNER